MKTLSREEARRVYDRIGSFQDSQGFYEDRAVDLLLAHSQLGSARHIFEFGCGTGRLALRLLSDALPPDAQYRGIDISPTMIGLAEKKLGPFAPRAAVALSDGGPPVAEPTGGCDRFLSTYVLDLLSEEDIAAVLREAHRMLTGGGLLCLTSLSTGSGFASRAVARAWSALHRARPSLVGGCRPLDLAAQLPPDLWDVRFREHVAPFAVSSEVVVAERRAR